jgi:iron complex outermembrane receptor protein
VFWEKEQVFLEDIERIEVIRGPGATLWGANAVNGVINIITKDPEEDQEMMVTGKAGTKNFREAVTRYSDSLSDKLSVSLTGGYREDEGTRGVNDWRRIPKATGRVKYKLSDTATVHFFAGVNESEIGLDKSKFTSSTDAHLRNDYQMIQWEQRVSDTSQFHLRVSRDYAELHTHDKQLFIEGGNVEVEAQHSFTLGERNHMVWGGNYRSTEAQSNIISSGTDHDDLIGFFLQEELTLSDTLTFVAGIKYEENSFTGGDWSSRGCILYSPGSSHHFRLALSRAYRTPGFFEDSGRFVKTLSSPLPPLPLALVKGNGHMDPEEMTAFELGYRTTLFDRIGLNLELYYNELDDVIDLVTVKQSIPFILSYDNALNAIAKGIEVALDVPLTPWWTLTANYTFQEVENKRENRDVQGTPRHKFNLGSSFTFNNGFTLDIRAHYVDDTRWDGLLNDIRVDDYVRLDIRIAQKLFNDTLEIALAGQNLTDKLHPEFSDGLETYEVERLIYGQLTINF